MEREEKQKESEETKKNKDLEQRKKMRQRGKEEQEIQPGTTVAYYGESLRTEADSDDDSVILIVGTM